MRNLRSHSWPVTTIAVLALVVACLGAAGASYAAVGITAKQARRIANTVVTNRAKTLTVAKAKKAALATKATTATTATTAGSAAELAGRPPAAYQDRIATEFLGSLVTVPAGATKQIMNPLPITVPPGVGYVHVTATAGFVTGSSNLRVWVQVDNPCTASGDGYDKRSLGFVANNQTTVPVDYVASVDPGERSVRLCVISGVDTKATNRTLTIQTVALPAT